MAASDLDRRGFLKGAGAVTAASFFTGSFARSALAAAAERNPRSSVRPFPLAQVELLDSPYRDNMRRVVAYLRFLDLDRMLHTFRVNGRPQRVPVEPGTYLTLPRRQWRAGRPSGRQRRLRAAARGAPGGAAEDHPRMLGSPRLQPRRSPCLRVRQRRRDVHVPDAQIGRAHV